MNRKASRGSTPRGGGRGGVRGGSRGGASTGKRSPAQGKQGKQASSAPKKRATADAPTATNSATPISLPPIRLGFVRGIAPSKWAERWARSVREQPLELVPVDLHEAEMARTECDVLLERVAPKARPEGSDEAHRTRHAMRLYEETIALVVAADHELAEQHEVSLEDLSLVRLLDHPDHFHGWPAAEAWADPTWMPGDANATLELVATGLGGALLAQPLARHLAGKRTHAVIPVARGGESLLPGSEIWASWRVERDANDVQRLVGTLRGRTARSSR